MISEIRDTWLFVQKIEDSCIKLMRCDVAVTNSDGDGAAQWKAGSQHVPSTSISGDVMRLCATLTRPVHQLHIAAMQLLPQSMADPDGLTTVIVSDRLVIAINTQAQIQSDKRIDVGTRERQSIGDNSAVNEYYNDD